MANITSKQISEAYQKLPADLKEAISGVETVEAIQVIAKKYGLMIDKIGELSGEIGLLMLGIVPPQDFIPNLAKRLGVERDVARKIAEEVNEQIFKKVRESLKQIHGLERSSAEKTPVSSVSTVPVVEIKQEEQKKEQVVLPANPFEAKTKEGVMRVPKTETNYDGKDPYREPIG